MTKTSRGYAYRLVKQVMANPKDLPACRLARLCIEREIPVSWIANELGVSRQTIYNWFTCASYPDSKHTARILDLIERLSQ